MKHFPIFPTLLYSNVDTSRCAAVSSQLSPFLTILCQISTIKYIKYQLWDFALPIEVRLEHAAVVQISVQTFDTRRGRRGAEARVVPAFISLVLIILLEVE